MKSYFTILFFACVAISSLDAQIYSSHTTTIEVANIAPITTPAGVQFRQLPSLPEALDFPTFLNIHATYPALAEDNNIEGTVVVAITVNAEGQVTDRRVVRGIHFLLDQAALEAVKKLPQMLPAVENGRPVAGTLTMPLRFRLR
jgi:TonB family protein